LKAYIRPHLGAYRLDAMTREAVQRTAAKLLATPRKFGGKVRENEDGTPKAMLSSKTVRRALNALLVALEDAVEKRLIGTNPARRIKLPKAPRKAVRWLSADEAATVIDSTEDEPLGPLWHLLIDTGMRPAEALGLTWENTDLQTGTVSLVQALIPLKLGKNPPKDAKRWRLDEPKTEQSRRSIPIPPGSWRTTLDRFGLPSRLSGGFRRRPSTWTRPGLPHGVKPLRTITRPEIHPELGRICWPAIGRRGTVEGSGGRGSTLTLSADWTGSIRCCGRTSEAPVDVR
jgi:integrase